MKRAARSVGRGYWELCKRFPWSTAFTVCYVKGSLSDVFAQTYLEDCQKVDVTRTAIYAAFGGWYCGWFQHLVYNITYSKLYGRATNWPTVLKKLFTDHFVHVPLICQPLYFLWQESLLIPLKHGNPVPRCDAELLRDVRRRWWNDTF